MIATEIFTGQTPAEDFRDELQRMMKDAALKLGCSVEELKYRFDNNGVVEIARMESSEVVEMETKRIHKKNVKKLRKLKGLN